MRRVLLLVALVAVFAYSRQARNGVVGYMECWITPQAWVNTSALRGWEGESVVDHEEDHVDQANEIGGCFRFNIWTLSKANRMRGEARAYCVSAFRTAMNRGWPMPVAIAHYAEHLSDPLYDFGITPEQARDTISAYCGRTWERFELK